MLAGIAVGWSINAMVGRDFANLCIAIGLWIVVGVVLWWVDRRNRSRRDREKVEEKNELRKTISTAVADGLLYAIRMETLQVPPAREEAAPIREEPATEPADETEDE